MNNQFYTDFTKSEIIIGKASMSKELVDAPKWLCNLFVKAWSDFEQGKFSYDGATFVKERYENTLFEVASFIHDWLNALGFVGFAVDYLFVEIMYLLGYDEELINARTKFLKYTVFNVIRRKIMNLYKKGSYLGDIDIIEFKQNLILIPLRK